MKKTKIVCTIGPKTESEEMLTKMLEAGMNVMRLNFSHGDYAEHGQRIQNLRNVMSKTGKKAAILLDTKGPEIRTIKLEGGNDVSLKAGQTFTFTTDKSVIGNNEIVAVTYEGFTSDLAVGNTVLVDDGLIGMEVTAIEGNKVICKVLNNGDLGENKGVNLPGVSIALPALAEKDKQDLIFGCEQGVDFVAASFIRKRSDVVEIREHLKAHGGENIQIISKIENQEGLNNFDEILEASDGIMVARGDMGVEIPVEEVIFAQKMIIEKCIRARKVVITATQMLDSMIENPRPTRAEITDVANAIYDGTSAIMLSGETAAGRYPVEAVQTMDAIARKTESHTDDARLLGLRCRNRMNITAATAHAACTTAKDIGADAILTVSQAGITAQMVSSFRPETTVVALLLEEQVQRQMALYWGVEPITMPRAENTDELVELAVQSAEKAGLIRHGDLVVITAGVPVGISGTTNMIRIQQVGGSLVNAVGIGSRTASGPLCVCRSVEEVAEKFHAGDVLVVPYTTNELLPYLRDAAAIICEEGSAECHAATVGLLLSKPVLVGAGDATRRLEDGVRVSVDCARGVVQTMPQ